MGYMEPNFKDTQQRHLDSKVTYMRVIVAPLRKERTQKLLRFLPLITSLFGRVSSAASGPLPSQEGIQELQLTEGKLRSMNASFRTEI